MSFEEWPGGVPDGPWGAELWRLDPQRAWEVQEEDSVGAQLGREVFQREVRALAAAVSAWRSGRGESQAVVEHARTLGVWGPPPTSRQVPPGPTRPLAVVDVVRMGTDVAPTAAHDGVARTLGLWFEALVPGRPEHLHLQRVAAALAMCDSDPSDEHDRSVIQRVLRRKPRPLRIHRDALRALLRAPVLPWRCGAPVAGCWPLQPALPIAPAWRPTAPVRIPAVGTWSAPLSAGDVVIAKVLPTPSGPVAPVALRLPGPLDAEVLAAEVALRVARSRLERPHVGLEDALMEGGSDRARALWSACAAAHR